MMMQQHYSKMGMTHQPSSPKMESIHGSSDSGNMSGGEMSGENQLSKEEYADIKQQVASSIRAGSKRSPAEIEEAIMRKKLRNRESAQRARDRQKARMRWLEEEVTRITGKNDNMLKENLLLRQVLGEQGQKIQELLRRDEERTERKRKMDAEADSRVSVKVENVEEAPPAPKKQAFWRPGMESESKPTKTSQDHLSKMRMNLISDHISTPTLQNPYSGLGFDQSRLTVPQMPYFPLGASSLSHSLQNGTLSNESLLLAQRIRQSQMIGEQ